MSLRARLTLLIGLSVSAAVVIVSMVAYFSARDRLRAEVDDSLKARAAEVGAAAGLPRQNRALPNSALPPRDPFAPNDVFFQVIDSAGSVVAGPNGQRVKIPVSSDDIAVAARTRRSFLRDTSSNGIHIRVITSPGTDEQAVQIARSLEEVDSSLGNLRRILFGVSGGGVVVAALLGLVVAHRSLRPIAHLTEAAEHVGRTRELNALIEVQSRDEVGRLARSFNNMLLALQESRRQQHQLVSDASHELRTPLTSLRTNIEVLIRANDMPEEERQELVRDVTFELEELTKLVGELVELASDKRVDAQEFEDVRLDQLVASLVERAVRRSSLHFDLDASPTLVVGNYNLLERAVRNLIDNALKWSPADSVIDVRVADGTVTVRDYGVGISNADRPYVFDRFYRADEARSKPGSGLGLAIVKQIVEAHGGTVWIEAPPCGGTVAGFRLAAVAVELEPEQLTNTDSSATEPIETNLR
jgi:two-component system sensor histidine kinase MprB